MNSTLSVIIINYNNEKYITASILSVINQSVQPDEILVVDDKSTDHSIQIIKGLQQQYNFKAIYADVNLGAAGNRDRAIRNATCEYVVCLDSDDLFKEDYIAAIKSYLPEANASTILASGFVVVNEQMNKLDEIETVAFCTQTKQEQLTWLAGRKRGMPGNQIVFAKAWYIGLGGYNTSLKLYEDWDFQIRSTIKNCVWVAIPGCHYFYRKNPNGLSSSSRLMHLKYQLKILKSFFITSRYKLSVASGILYLIFKKGSLYLLGKNRTAGHN